MRGIELPEDCRLEIVEWCRSRYPYEACGLLAGGSDLRVEKVYPVENSESESPRKRYFMDPGGQIRAVRDAERQGLEVIGAFHSHTNSPAYPSSTDLELAMYPEWVWVIVSLAAPDRPDVRAFVIRDFHVSEVEILAGG